MRFFSRSQDCNCCLLRARVEGAAHRRGRCAVKRGTEQSDRELRSQTKGAAQSDRELFDLLADFQPGFFELTVLGIETRSFTSQLRTCLGVSKAVGVGESEVKLL